MKIEKKLIKELVDYLSEFNLTEIEYQEGTKKIKVSKASRGALDTGRASAIVSPTKSVLSNNNEQEGVRIKSPIIDNLQLIILCLLIIISYN